MIEFKGVRYPKSEMVHAVFFYLRYAVSYRDLEKMQSGGYRRLFDAEPLGSEIRTANLGPGASEEAADRHLLADG